MTKKEEQKTKERLAKMITEYDRPCRQTLSARLPRLKWFIIFMRRFFRYWQNQLGRQLCRRRRDQFFPSTVARHQSVLRRKLGNSDPRLQERKITNLKLAAAKLDGLVINPGKTFSFWHAVGKPTRRRGYVKGMLLANGEIREGIGGGLCQMSNLLFWLFLHTPMKITERYHHSLDVFPDSGRTLPFGSGATILYNFVDLKIKNVSAQPLQLKVWVTDKHLKGKILSPEPLAEKFHVIERCHAFARQQNRYFRFNEIWREKIVSGVPHETEKITTNFAPVKYAVNPRELTRRYSFFDL
jgi:vancomycin resistance protein VanW